MYRFERKITVRNVADMPAAMQFASEVTDYLNKRYDLHMKFGAEGFDKHRVHWFYDFDSADKTAALGTTLLTDPDYVRLVNKAKDLWLDGSLEDTFVNLAN
jgi:triacylglycerol esterase/lipase EstA (alpha/beta hydrolase family)